MSVLVVGGAGYIGSHMVRLLDKAGYDVVVLDNLTTGFAPAVTAGEFYVGDMRDRQLVEQIITNHRVEAVMHFAACALVGESVTDPAKYYQNNIVATLELMESMRRLGVHKMVFSSTCATYGIPTKSPITEAEPQKPVNPYGFTKLAVEQALADYAQAYGFGYATLRYFNASGASPAGDIGEDHMPETHLIPLVLQVALGQREKITVFGDDWPTPDGTCIRDYIHVDDLGAAHLAALQRLAPGVELKLNLGTGHGNSVLEVIQVCQEITGRPIPYDVGPRRAGDPPALVADASLARHTLHWRPQYTQIRDIVDTAWRWHLHHPNGYRNR